MKKYNNYNKFKKMLISKYEDIKFTDEFYEKWSDDIDGMKMIFFKKLYNFYTFYNTYNTKGIRINNGIDSYESANEEYKKIINKELYTNTVLHNPDSILKNIIMLLEIDRYKAEQNTK